MNLATAQASVAATSNQAQRRQIGAELANSGRGPARLSIWVESAQRMCKRLVDIVGAGTGLLLLAMPMLVIALLIRLDSRGPILFCQIRMGKYGKLFTIYKFRTMTTEAEERLRELEHLNESEGGVLFKIKRDPRTTPIGQILRRTSLDELPQLFNVLKGEMSLVGPRPLQLRDCTLLDRVATEEFARRQRVIPGLTGLWQVKGRSETGFEQMLKLDIDYVEQWSLWLDLSIIVQTFFSVVSGRGAF